LLGAIGCGEDNEKAVTGPAVGPVAVPATGPKTQEEYGKQAETQQRDMQRKMGYPGMGR